jgi:hypothetical protein
MKTLTALVIAMLLAAFAATAAQQESSKNWTQPRTPDGQPDVQGIWTNYTSTPFEVPDESDRSFFLPERHQRSEADESKIARCRSTERPRADHALGGGGP